MPLDRIEKFKLSRIMNEGVHPTAVDYLFKRKRINK